MAIPTIPLPSALPLVLAGPIVRRVTPNRVAVWVATRLKASVTLTIVNAPSSTPSTAQTTQIGANLYVALVEVIVSGAGLDGSTVYFYDLSFSGTGVPPGGLMADGIVLPAGTKPDPNVLSYPAVNTSAATAGLPSFVVPQLDLSRLRICQGSCRKPHADSVDMMAVLDDDIGKAFTNLTDTNSTLRVQQLFLTGDQIYADDVADSLMFLIQKVARQMVGDDPLLDGIPSSDPRLQIGLRGVFAHDVCKFTSDPADKVPQDVQVAKNHLLTFTEFCAMYLLTLSPALWPSTSPTSPALPALPALPAFADIYDPTKFPATIDNLEDPGSYDTPKFRDFKRENAALTSFFQSLPAARRALANVATYMLVDDHEVCDDFYINRRWVLNIIDSEAGKAAIRNALLAYGIFQAWGNVPSTISTPSASPFQPLVDRANTWFTSGFSPKADVVLGELKTLLRIPTALGTGDASFDVTSPGSLTPIVWGYVLTFSNYEVIALDMRSHRLYPARKQIGPAALVTDQSILDQIPDPATPFVSGDGVTIVITPGPWTGLSLIESAQRNASTPEKVFDLDVELLHFDAPAFDGLIARCAARRNNSRVVVFAGDIHHAFSTRFQYWSRSKNPLDATPVAQDTRTTFAHFISSAIKNQDISRKFIGTLAVHYAGFRGDLRDITRLGWRAPAGVDTLKVGTATVMTNIPVPRTVSWDVPVGGRNQKAVTELDIERNVYTAVTPDPARTIDWRMREQLFAGDPKSVSTNPVSTGVEILVGLILVFIEWLFGYIPIFSGGKEVVGVNNIGFVTLHWGTGDDKSATQVLKWFNASYDKLYQEQAKGGQKLMDSLTKTTVTIPLPLDAMPTDGTITF